MNIRKSQVQSKKKPSVYTQREVQKIVSENIAKIKSFFSRKAIDEVAREVNLVQRKSAKIKGFDFLLSMLLASLDTAHTSLERISTLLTRINPNIRVMPQSLMDRINSKQAVRFLSRLLEMILKERIIDLASSLPVSLFCHFNKVLIQDSTVLELHEKLQDYFKGSGGRASKSSAKIDVIYDLLGKKYEKITLTDQSEADSRLAIRVQDVLIKNALVIRDLGYLRMDSLIEIDEKGAYYLSRFKSGLLMFLNQDDERPLDLIKYVSNKTMKKGVIDFTVYITQKRVPARLIVYVAPQDVVDKRRRLAKATAKKQGRTLQENTIALMQFTLFITNVPASIWKANVVGTIYGIRWQIELIFKSWKSGIGINYLKGINPNRIRSLIYARLILITVINEVYRMADWMCEKAERAISMYKTFEWMREADRLIHILKGKLRRWEERYFLEIALKSMCKQKRKRKTTLESISRGVSYG
jgi:hypothetical protein